MTNKVLVPTMSMVVDKEDLIKTLYQQLHKANETIEKLESALSETYEQVYDNTHIDNLVQSLL